MDQFSLLQDIVISILPVFVFIFMGWVFRKRNVFSVGQIQSFKKLVVNFTLPSLLFLAFFSMPLNQLSFLLAGLIFICSLFALGYGYFIAPKLLPGVRTGAFVFSGYEAGMLGYGLFLGFFGQEHLGLFALIDLGQVLFVFLVLVPLVKSRSGLKTTLVQHVQTIFHTPVVWAIGLGLAGAALNRIIIIEHTLGMKMLIQIFQILGAATVPLISISVGYDLLIEQKTINRSVLVVLSRMIVMVAFAFFLTMGILPLLLGAFPQLESTQLRLLRIGIWILFLLPPPFVIPAFLPSEAENEAGQISSILSVHTLVSVVLIPVVVIILTMTN